MNWSFIAICLVIIGVLAWQIRNTLKRLNARIAEFDLERRQNPLDPFSAWMDLLRLQSHTPNETENGSDRKV